MRHSPSPDFPTCWRPFDTPSPDYIPSRGLSSSGKNSVAEPATSIQRQLSINFRSASSSFQSDAVASLTHHSTEKFSAKDATNATSAPCRDLRGGDDRAPRCLSDRARPPACATQPGDTGTAGAAAGSAGGAAAPRQRPALGSTLRSQALDELLASIREYRAASPAFRPYWRKLAMHDIRRFRRDYLQPEWAAFEAAVRRSQQQRAAP